MIRYTPLLLVSLLIFSPDLRGAGVPILPGSGALAYVFDFEEPDVFDYGVGWAGAGFGLTGTQRGAPEEIWQGPTPPDGVDGSTTALFFRRLPRTPEWYALHPGAVGHRTYGQPDQENQDDFFASPRIFTAAERFSITVRVHVNLERSAQATFGLRTTAVIENTQTGSTSNHWPAVWIYKVDGGDGVFSDLRAFIRTPYGAFSEYYDLPDIPGWWTLGMSFDETGDIHYFARPDAGVLTREDYLTSASRYGSHQRFLRNLDAAVFISTSNFDESEAGSIQVMDHIEIHTGGLDFYDVWAASYFPPEAFVDGRATGLAARDVDANGSGRSNFEEYLMGHHPAGTPALFALQANRSEAGLDLRFLSRPERVYTLYGSPDLIEWEPLQDGIEGTGEDLGWEPEDLTGFSFFRLGVWPRYWVGPEGL